MQAFTFYNPTKILFGEGQIAQLGREMNHDGISRCLLIAGGGSIKANGAYTQVTDSLMKARIEIFEAWGVQANPRLDKTREIIGLAREHKVEAILAVGGGSVIDTAKAVAAGFYLQDVWNAFTRKESVKQALPIYTVLTISATGSEMNGNAVITNTDTYQKWGMYSPLVYPRLSIIDPGLQSTLSFRQTASGAMDAIAHILEYYFANDSASTTLAINAALIRTIITMTDRLKQNARDTEARANLAWAATMALNGMSGIGLAGGDWACHSIEHSYSALHQDIVHGEGLGVIFPAWIGYVSDRAPARFAAWAKEVWAADSVASALHKFRQKREEWGMPGSLRDLGIKDPELPKLLDIIMSGAPMGLGGVFKLNKEDLQSLLVLAF
ncbi:Long-chain-alcohol dehydrogenase 2 [anaerobic digester metagenome]